MSLDLYVHSKSPRLLTTEQLADALAVSQIGVALFDDYINYNPAPAGPLKTCIVLGWMTKSFAPLQINEILRQTDKKQKLEELLAREVLACANVNVYRAVDYYAAFGDGYLDSLAGEIDLRFLNFMKSAETVYEIQTAAGRLDSSWRFQQSLCSAIADSVDGLIEEPQLGEYFFPQDAVEYFHGFVE